MKLFYKTTSVLLLILFVYNTIGYTLIFAIGKKVVKEKMKEQIAHKSYGKSIELITFSVNQNMDTYLCDDGHELSFDGKLYDILQVINEGGLVKIYCINDHEEQSLVLAYLKLVNHNTTSAKTKGGKNFKSGSLSDVFETSISIADAYSNSNTFTFLPDIRTQFHSVLIEKGTPPPQKQQYC